MPSPPPTGDHDARALLSPSTRSHLSSGYRSQPVARVPELDSSRRPTAGRGVQRARAVTSGCEEPQSSRQYSHDLVMLQKAGRNPSLSTRCGQPSGLYADQVVAP